MANVYGMIFQIEDKTKSGARSINRTLDALRSSADRTKSALRGIGSVASSAVGSLGKTAAAATAAAAAFGFLAKKNLDALDALGKTATKLGVSTNFLSEYSVVASQAGLSTDQFNTGLQRFLRRLGQAQQGTGELLKPLERLGINMKDANGNFREGTEVFEEFLTKLGATANDAQKLALAMGAFDTEGVAFINIADMGATQIAKLRREAELAGYSIDRSLVKGAEDANDALDLLLLRAKGFSANFFGAMGPAIATLATDIRKGIDDAVAGSGGMENFAKKLSADFLENAGRFIKSLGVAIDGFINGIAKAINVMKQVIVSISKIPGAGFDATFGTAEEVAALERKKDIVAERLAAQKKLLEDNQAELDKLNKKYDELPGGILGKKDPTNIAGQIASAAMAAHHFQGRVDALQSELEDLDNTFVFDKMATDVEYVGDELDEAGDKLIKASGAIREGLVKETAKVAENIAETNPIIARQIELFSKLKASAQALLDNIITPNKELAASFDDQQKKLATLIERFDALDTGSQASLNNSTQAAGKLRSEILLLAKDLDGLPQHFQDRINTMMMQEFRQNAGDAFDDVKLRVELLKEELKDYTRIVELTGTENERNTAIIRALAQALDLAEGELRSFTGALLTVPELEKKISLTVEADEQAMKRYQEFLAAGERSPAEKKIARGLLGIPEPASGSGIKEITTLADLQSRISTDSQKAANNMNIFKEFVAQGSYSAEELQAAMSLLGISMDQLPYEQFKVMFEDTVNKGITSTNNLKKLQGELNKLVEDGVELTEVQQKMLDNINQQLGTETFNVTEKLKGQFEGLIGSVSSSFADVLLGLKDGFTTLEDIALQSIRMIISTLIEAIIRATILKETVSFGGGGLGGLLGGIFSMGGAGILGLGGLILGGIALGGGFRANGGPVRTGESYMVGERGPEIFTPNTSGSITSNEEMNAMKGEGDLSVNFTINAIDTQTGVEFLLENKRVITGVIQEAYMRRGTSGPLG